MKITRKRYTKVACDRCGEVKFCRPWGRVAMLCQDCIKIAEKESRE